MNVKELIEHLQKQDQTLEVWYMSGDDFYKASENDFKKYGLAEDEGYGKEFDVFIVGDVP